MNLNLDRPVAFFDLETTGTDVPTDRIVEISILKIFPDQKKSQLTRRVNPGIPIPPESTQIHGIADEDVAEEPTFEELSSEVYDFIFGCDLAGYNSNRFDIPILVEEFLRVGVDYDPRNVRHIDVQSVFHKMEQRTLSAAYKFYCNKTIENAHSAQSDVEATYEVLLAQLDRYDEIENDFDFLHEFSKRNNGVLDFVGRIALNEDNVAIFNFGKFKGKPVKEVLKDHPGYFNWIMESEFPRFTKKILKEIKDS